MGHWVSPDAFLLGEAHERPFEDPNFSVLMRGAAQALSEHDISLVLIMAGTPAEQRRAKDFILGGHVDAVLLVSSHSRGQTIVEDIYKAGIPIIACGIPLGHEGQVGYVAADDFNGARAAGMRVPEDIAVAGFDDSPVAVASDPEITTMRQPFR